MSYDERYFIPRPERTGLCAHDHGLVGSELPTYREADGSILRWSSNYPLPNIGDKIMITMNGIGPAIVHGYFAAGEPGKQFLGVMTEALHPPSWLSRQRREDQKDKTKPEWYRRGIGCEYGTEIRPFKRGDMTAHRKRTAETNRRRKVVA